MREVIVTARLPGPALEGLRVRGFSVVPEAPRDGVTRDDLVAMARAHPGCEGLVAVLTVPVDAGVLAALPALRVVANVAVGVDNVDLAAARARGVVVCNTPDVLTDATADLAMALVLACARRVVEGDRVLRAGAWPGWSPTYMLGLEVTGATLGVVGMGRIGRAVARRAAGFEMKVLYATRSEVEAPAGARRVALDELLAASDFVSLHCPLTEETRGMIDARALSLMRPTAYLVNTARGAVVDEPALARALRDGVIAGAGLDVFAKEPAVPPELLAAPNTVLLPHLGSATVPTREAMASRAVEGLIDVLEGRAPRFRV